MSSSLILIIFSLVVIWIVHFDLKTVTTDSQSHAWEKIQYRYPLNQLSLRIFFKIYSTTTIPS